MSETLRSSGSEARPDARRGEAVGGVPGRPRRRSDSASSVVPGDEMERAGDVKQRRDVSIDVRLTSGERSAIDARALVLGVKPSAWVRAAALDGLDARSARIERLEAEAVLQHRPEQASAVEQLRRVGVNLNQVQRTGNATNEQLLREVLDAVAEVRAAFGDRIRL
ncbi:MAG: plasmid mobilization protein [Leucobacter sp.]